MINSSCERSFHLSQTTRFLNCLIIVLFYAQELFEANPTHLSIDAFFAYIKKSRKPSPIFCF